MTIPEGRLSDSARQRRRAELMEAIASDDTGRRWIAPVAAAAVVAVVGGAAYGVTALRGPGPGEAEPAGSGSESVSEALASETTVAPTSSAPTEAACESSAPGTGRRMMRQQMAEYREQLPLVQAFRDVLAVHLDPKGEHLEAKTTSVQSSGSGCMLTALGTKVGWTTAGEDGMGLVQVEVSDGSDLTQVRMAHEGWRPLPVDVAGVSSARQVEYDGGFAVEVERTDGLTVSIDASLLFGNNSLVPIESLPFGVAALVRTAADPRFQLP